MLSISVNRSRSAILAGVAMLVIAAAGVNASEKDGPATVEAIPGSDLKRLTLTPKAAERLDIQTVPLREEKVRRRIIVLGEVLEQPVGQSSGTGSKAVNTMGVPQSAQFSGKGSQDSIGSPFRVRILLHDDDEDDLGEDDLDDDDDDDDDAEVLAPDDDDDDDDDEPLMARRVVLASSNGSPDVLYFKMKSGARGLRAGQHVGVRLIEPGSDMLKKVVPYSAIIYDVHGEIWVYTSPEPLVFVRHGVTIDHIDQEMAVLQDGPDVGTPIVTVGAATLLGTEFGVGH